MGIDWYTKHMPFDFGWKELTERITVWKTYAKGTFPEDRKTFDRIEHPSGAEVVLTENIGAPTKEDIEKYEMTQESIDEWMEDTGAYTYLSFRASSYPALGEKVNLIMEYFLHTKDIELENFVAKALEADPDAVENSKGGVDFFKSIFGLLSQFDSDCLKVGGKMEGIDALSNRISGAIYFRDLKWQECKMISELFKRVSEYCKLKSEDSPDDDNFFGYYTNYFKGGSDFMNACFANQIDVTSSY